MAVRNRFCKCAERRDELLGGGDGEFGRFAGGGGANVGGEVTQGDVDFVADGGDDGDSRGEDGPDDRFFVERPQVLDTAAAAGDDDTVGRVGQHVDHGDSPGDLHGRPGALDERRDDQNVHPAVTPAHDLQEVPNRRARRAGHHGNPRDGLRKRLLVDRIEKPLFPEFFLQLPKRRLQRPHPDRFNPPGDQLIASPRRVDVDTPVADDFLPILQIEPQPCRRRSPHNGTNLRPVILQRKINVPRPRPSQIGNLPRHPHIGKTRLQQPFNAGRKLRHTKNIRFFHDLFNNSCSARLNSLPLSHSAIPTLMPYAFPTIPRGSASLVHPNPQSPIPSPKSPVPLLFRSRPADRTYMFFIFGSNASRNPSPRKFSANNVNPKARPGNKTNHQ